MTRRKAWLITGGYWVLMALITHSPPIFGKSDTPSPTLGLDKLGHLVGFAIFAFLLRAVVRWPVGVIVLVAAVYAGVDELTQPPFGRTADPKDWIADMLGVGVGLALAILFERARPTHDRNASNAGKSAGPVADAVHPQP